MAFERVELATRFVYEDTSNQLLDIPIYEESSIILIGCDAIENVVFEGCQGVMNHHGIDPGFCGVCGLRLLSEIASQPATSDSRWPSYKHESFAMRVSVQLHSNVDLSIAGVLIPLLVG